MIYFDYASSTPVRPEVLESFDKIIKEYFANPSSAHKPGLSSSTLLKKAREQIASFLNVKDNEIIFTSGASESNNMAIKGIAFKYQNRGKHIITSAVEHSSVLKVFKQLENEFGFEVTYLDVDSNGQVSVDALKSAMRKDTILVSLMHVNNEMGAINDIDSIGKFIKQNYPKCFFHSDLTQSVGKIDVKLDNIDLASFSAHKFYGFKGSGVLVKKENVALMPLIVGGAQEDGLRAGTSNLAYDVCLAKALRLQLESKDKDYELVSKMHDYLVESIAQIDGIVINSPKICSPYILNISILGKKSAIIADYLGSFDISVSNTSACSTKNVFSYVIENMYKNQNRSDCCIRISLSNLNTMDECKELVKCLTLLTKEVI